MRKIFTGFGFEGPSFRKDFSLAGRVQVKYDPEQERVLYEPVNLVQEYRDFDYTSPWEGMPKSIDDHSEQEYL